MAIARDANSNGNASATSLTFSHTCGGANRLLLVGVTTYGGAAVDIVTGITYNGTSLTKIDHQNCNALAPTAHLYYLIAPSTGANNIVISTSLTGLIIGIGASYTGCKQTGQPDGTSKNNTGGATSLSSSITTTADNSWMTAMFTVNNGTSPTASAGSSILVNETGSGQNSNCFLDSNGAKTPAGSYSIGLTWTSSNRAAIVAASISPSIDSTSPSFLLNFL